MRLELDLFTFEPTYRRRHRIVNFRHAIEEYQSLLRWSKQALTLLKTSVILLDSLSEAVYIGKENCRSIQQQPLQLSEKEDRYGDDYEK
jgi:hypothetical protein